MREGKMREARLTAMAMAMWLSVTVSIGDDMMGVLSDMFLVNEDVKSCRQNTPMYLLTLSNTHRTGGSSLTSQSNSIDHLFVIAAPQRCL